MSYLIKCAKERKMHILFTPENVKTAGWIREKGLTDVKIPSSAISDKELLKFINKNFKTVYMSTGMASLGEVRNAVRHLGDVRDLYILHCISEYPTGPLLEKRGLVALAHEDVRLNMMKMLIRLYPEYRIGYSDHTAGIFAPVLAVAAGAKVIEKHITLDRAKPLRNFKKGLGYLGTDHVLSLKPDELAAMVRQIREAEKILGEWKWERSSGEKLLRRFLRNRFT